MSRFPSLLVFASVFTCRRARWGEVTEQTGEQSSNLDVQEERQFWWEGHSEGHWYIAGWVVYTYVGVRNKPLIVFPQRSLRPLKEGEEEEEDKRGGEVARWTPSPRTWPGSSRTRCVRSPASSPGNERSARWGQSDWGGGRGGIVGAPGGPGDRVWGGGGHQVQDGDQEGV